MRASLQWGIFLTDLDPAVGSEQAGTRPVIVVSAEFINQTLPIVSVLPLTGRKPGRKIYPTEVLLGRGIAGLPQESIVLAHQCRTISKRRLGRRYGTITDQHLISAIRDSMRVFFDHD